MFSFSYKETWQENMLFVSAMAVHHGELLMCLPVWRETQSLSLSKHISPNKYILTTTLGMSNDQ